MDPLWIVAGLVAWTYILIGTGAGYRCMSFWDTANPFLGMAMIIIWPLMVGLRLGE